MNLKVVREGVLPVTIQDDLDRYMRMNNQITGLIDLYATADVFGDTGVEIGSYWGESAEIAAQFLGQLTCVDPWSSWRDEDAFITRMKRFPHVIRLRRKSHHAAPLFEDGSLAIVYIDGRHDYGNVLRDILLWFPKVRIGGWVGGHDYDENESHAGVVRAVDEVFGVPEQRFEDMSFLFQKTPEMAADIAERYPQGYVLPDKASEDYPK